MTDEWTHADVPRLDGEVIVVTGANSGLGLEGTRTFARRGATVVMACRSTERGEDAAREIRGQGVDGGLDVRPCDLADLSSVASFAEGVDAEYGAVDVLCNNAGLMATPRGETADGFETQFGVNHLGHFALTGHLLDALHASDGEARVVTQASRMHERGEIDFEDIHGETEYDRWDSYAQSKLANILFAYELQRRLDGTDLKSVACHPGWAATNLQARAGEGMAGWLGAAAMGLLNALVAQSARQGVLSMVYAATASNVDGGSYVGPGGFMNMRGTPEVQRSSDRSYDRRAAERLWELSVEETGVTYGLQEQAPADD